MNTLGIVFLFVVVIIAIAWGNDDDNGDYI
jgi:hypothetical protein